MQEILGKETLDFFPKEGIWYYSCFSKPKELEMKNLPCHLRDNVWLAKMFKKKKELVSIDFSDIVNFVETSSLFQEKRHEYELEIVKWQIKYMISGGENWIIDHNYGGECLALSMECDIGFRKGVVDTLSAIGMDNEVIEEEIEKNAILWRDRSMGCAFSNEFEPITVNFRIFIYGENNNNEDIQTVDPVDPDFKENWLKMRKYEYYQKHKDSVDKYGVIEPGMILSDFEVRKLKKYLLEKKEERVLQLKQEGSSASSTKCLAKKVEKRKIYEIWRRPRFK